jgi:cytochrome P450
VTGSSASPIGASVTLAQLEDDPHELLARLREREPVSWVPVLDGWLVTRHDLALEVMRDAQRFTVDDPRFSTGQVVGPSMLSLDGAEHAAHRDPFAGPFRPNAVREQFAGAVAAEAERLIDALAPAGRAELRRSFAGPLAAATITLALGLGRDQVAAVLESYDAIVAAVTEITAGGAVPTAGEEAFAQLHGRVAEVVAAGQKGVLGAVATSSELTREQIVSNAAVLLFGGIETTEGMIANAALELLRRPDQLAAAANDRRALDAAIEESLRLEPAAAMVDRYATADVALGSASIARGELVHVSITGANRDPAVFQEPDRFDPSRPNVRRHLAFAHGPHVCLGVHLARLEARTAVATILRRLPTARLDPDLPSTIRGLVFRKPPGLHVVWE